MNDSESIEKDIHIKQLKSHIEMLKEENGIINLRNRKTPRIL